VILNQPFSPSPQSPALVIGAAGVDIVGRLKKKLASGTSAPGRIRSSFGGVARNVAENLARLGQPVNLITVVGGDEPGDRLLNQLDRAGVNIEAVMHAPDCPTGAYLGIVKPSGDLEYAVDDMGAIKKLTPAYLREREHLFQEASTLFMDANLSRETLRTGMSLARKARLPVCADPTSSLLAPRLEPYLSQLSMITPNGHEAAVYCENLPPPTDRRKALTAAQRLVGQGVGIAIVTMGELGLCYATSETNGYIPAIRTDIEDPTGAGDALTAAVIFALLNDIPMDDAVRLGVSAASLTLRYWGAVVPDLTLEKLYDELVI
jgi:pseudouridine kinase